MRRKHELPVGDRTRNQHLLTGHWLEQEVSCIIANIEDEGYIPDLNDVLDTLADQTRNDTAGEGVPTTYDSDEARAIARKILRGG